MAKKINHGACEDCANDIDYIVHPKQVSTDGVLYCASCAGDRLVERAQDKRTALLAELMRRRAAEKQAEMFPGKGSKSAAAEE